MSCLLSKLGNSLVRVVPKTSLLTFSSSSFCSSRLLDGHNILISNSLGIDFPKSSKEYIEQNGGKLTILDLEIDRNKRYNSLLKHVSSNKNNNYSGLIITLEDNIDSNILNELIKNNNNFKIVSTMSVGYNHININTCKQQNILIGYTPDILTETTADLVVGLTLATSRRFIEASNAAKNGEWGNWSPLWMCGKDLNNSTVGIIGMGSIGLAVAKRLLAFNCDILYCNGSGKENKLAKELGLEYVSFDRILTNSDFIIPLCPLNDKTKNLFTIEEFEMMKNDCIFINCSRGDIVNQNDLIKALNNNLINSCGLDVTSPEPLPLDNPLFKMNNVTILPHIGSASYNTRNAMSIQSCNNIIDAINNRQSKYILKF